jgi:hypothetical protein
MIHSVLLSLHQSLPFSPPAVVAAVGIGIVVLALSLYGRSRTAVLFSLAVVLLGAGLAVGLTGVEHPAAPRTWGGFEDLAESLIGPPSFRGWETFTAAGLALALLLLYALYNTLFQEKPGERPRRLLEGDEEQGKALGSAHLCRPGAFKRWSKPEPQGWTLRGRFWGAGGRPLGSRFCLGGEDVARGVAVFGAQGTGKTQSVILPAIADRMRDGHSLVVTDVQGELLPYVQLFASATGHTVLVHNPSDPARSCALNLCDWIDNVADAKAMSAVLHSHALLSPGDQFWTQSAINLVAACALHYPSFGAVLAARGDIRQMARDLKASRAPGAADLAADFAASILAKDSKLGLNIMATAFNIGLAAWADPAVREVTGRTDVDLAVQMTRLPTVVVLRCARRHIDTYGPYLGTVLRVLTTRLDDLGQQAGGALPIPVGLVLEEFPALGRLESLVRDINLVRKRRISVLTAAQSVAQFDHVYPHRGEADRLMAGLATKIVFGGCDARTAEYFSRLSGQQTVALASLSRAQRRPGQPLQDSASASLRGRALLLPDDLIRPGKGHATVFAAYGEAGRADQAVFHAELMPLFKRKDWPLDRLQPRPVFALPRPDQGRSEPRPGPAGEPEQAQALELAAALADEEDTLER